ncbi:TetR/AcrR family transcriptional regulator C-terminal ligand-binding domain-containing protein [Nocardioides sp. TRM66260-LWL]|uniref:TetR-like C-terminal domain-containing protein n=1 Tax=Nocardioides sp. TRM66260-LWL TaxID=2874478 RepID=UPI001CC5568C|nr:TetR-like C-terminal domain-containing protein [Nocardioides sp. TRM66260-LWL]MBZ5733060.1 TetR/AcrR family transcriptional regulator C-terminal ligand-binding domain-containing protein [Nocardioides sp. TRM66260-LWL]
MTPTRTRHDADEATPRPRIEGEREQEVFAATLAVLADVGYDRLTMDAVATAAKASKATLYRRWEGKGDLVVDALVHHKGQQPPAPDTGCLRTDLVAAFCGLGGTLTTEQMSIFASVVTALHRDADLAREFRSRVIGPKVAATRAIFERARDRGEIAEDVDLDLLAPALPGIVLHRVLVLGDVPAPDLVERVIDQIVLPVAGHAPTAPHLEETHP